MRERRTSGFQQREREREFGRGIWFSAKRLKRVLGVWPSSFESFNLINLVSFLNNLFLTFFYLVKINKLLFFFLI